MKFKLFIIVGLMLIAILPINALAQKRNENTEFITLRSSIKSPTKAGYWRLDISKEAPANIRIESKEAPVSEIVAALSNQLRIGIEISRVIKDHKVSHVLPPATLEALLLQLAPFVMMEYEISSASAVPVPKAAYLYAWNEHVPATVINKYN